MAVKIVTDSTADLPLKCVQQYEINVVPLKIHLGEDGTKGVDFDSAEFYNRMRNGSIDLNTSQPSPGEFLKVYQAIASPNDTVISIHLSEELSGTVRSAKIAAQMLGENYRVEVIDSRLVSMALGLIVLKAARLAQNNALPLQILEKIHTWKQEVAVYFTLDNLEYVQKMGRIGKASSLIGSLLNIKPVLSIIDGIVVPIEKVRGNIQKVASVMIEKLIARFGKRPLMVCILHTEIPAEAQVLQTIATENLNISELFLSIVNPIIGAHSGPFTLGIVALPLS